LPDGSGDFGGSSGHAFHEFCQPPAQVFDSPFSPPQSLNNVVGAELSLVNQSLQRLSGMLTG
jgi:hypothetical protein